jgi:hypothetical protein
MILGAIVDRGSIPRHPTRFQCLRAFLPDEVIDLLAKFVDDAISKNVTSGVEKPSPQKRTVAPEEIWRWIAQRLDISLNVKITIDTAYKSV